VSGSGPGSALLLVLAQPEHLARDLLVARVRDGAIAAAGEVSSNAHCPIAGEYGYLIRPAFVPS
jgi:hypothetical protein